ncbi:lipoyl synthase [Nitrosophilus kaiyonis]|uniref:lipoyl synthase n=1 Tax=Nitrosophilus kaiyonis TaxID=2930200 RepID=UPI0024931879|nr:lipoyl synthase [Nitrosophilus kaiyonis]
MNFQKPKVKAPSYELIHKTKNIIDKYSVNTICIESACPNISECFSRNSATFLILGDICTRKCKFCNVKHGKPNIVDSSEPKRVANAINELGLKYVVITSVDRDDLSDYGVSQYVKVTKEIKKINKNIKIELLTPDFHAKKELMDKIINSNPYKLSHNIETVESLYKNIMPGCSYKRSLKVLEYYAKTGILTKSSIMVGLGEKKEELIKTFYDLFNCGVKQISIGQYLSPSFKHHLVIKYYNKKEFDELKEIALDIGFDSVQSGILVRSSYYADKM